MHNLVELKYTYEEISYTITKNSVEAFELLLEHVKPEDSNNDFEVNNIYNYQQLTNFVGCNISPSVLMSLVRRGLLYCDGKMNKRNYYAITDEIYDYYNNIYKPTKEKYKREMEEFFNKNRRKRHEENQLFSEES